MQSVSLPQNASPRPAWGEETPPLLSLVQPWRFSLSACESHCHGQGHTSACRAGAGRGVSSPSLTLTRRKVSASTCREACWPPAATVEHWVHFLLQGFFTVKKISLHGLREMQNVHPFPEFDLFVSTLVCRGKFPVNR